MKKINYHIKFPIFLCIIIGGISTFAQNNDNGLWLSGNVKYDVLKKLDGSSGFSVRFDNNFLQYSSINFETGLEYKLIKDVEAEIGYRYSTDNYKYENRLSLALKWEDKIIKRTHLGIKTKYQTESVSDEYHLINTWRTKFELTHRIKKTEVHPNIFTEWFVGLNPTEYNFNKARVGCGLDFKQFKKHSFSIRYFKNIDLKGSNRINSNILSIDYKLKL